MRAVTRLATPTITNMPPRFHTVAICGVVAALACGKTDRTPLESLPDARTNLQFVVDTAYLFPGTRRSLSAALTDSHGRPLMASKAVITTSDSTVAVIDSVTRETRRNLNGGISYDGCAEGCYTFLEPTLRVRVSDDGPTVATVRLLVRESSSDVRELRATGRIRKVTEWPEIPITNDYSLMDWSCG